MDQLAAALGGILATTGIVGAIAIGVIVGLVAALILWSRISGLFADTRVATQQSEFQKTLLDSLKRVADAEKALRDELEETREDKARLQHALAEATVSIELMRAQQRRLIDLFGDVIAGRRDAASIDLAELGGQA